MSDFIITIDTGTTNTRTAVWDSQGALVCGEKRETGVRNTAIDGDNSRLKRELKDCLDTLLQRAGLEYGQVKQIAASGMITSGLGLAEIPHLTAPAGIDDLARAAVAMPFPEICPLPIWFIPGVKNAVGTDRLDEMESMDIMRGEETEAAAIIHACHSGKPMVLVLPGSHTKFISVDCSGRITGCLTTIGGELLACITTGTILADAVERRFAGENTYDREMLLLGYDTAEKTGLGRACFTGRILGMFAHRTPEQIANYLLGAVLQGDIQALRQSSALRTDVSAEVVVAGKNPLRQALADLLEHGGFFPSVGQYVPEGNTSLSALGVRLIMKRRAAQG